MELIERIGAILGLAAFVGFAVLALFYFQQARDVRRLREWAGKAPERAAAAQTATGTGERPAAEAPGRLGRIGDRIGSGLGRAWDAGASAWAAADRRSPLDLRILAAALLLGGLVAAAILTSGFGLLGEDARDRQAKKPALEPSQVEVAVFNGTASGAEPVPGLADQAANDVEEAGFELGQIGDTSQEYSASTAMYEPGHRRDAELVAKRLRGELGEIEAAKMVDEEVRADADGADVALVVGQTAGQ